MKPPEPIPDPVTGSALGFTQGAAFVGAMNLAVHLAGFTGPARRTEPEFWLAALVLGFTPFVLGIVIDVRRAGQPFFFALTLPWRAALAIVSLAFSVAFTRHGGFTLVAAMAPCVVLTADRTAGALRALVGFALLQHARRSWEKVRVTACSEDIAVFVNAKGETREARAEHPITPGTWRAYLNRIEIGEGPHRTMQTLTLQDVEYEDEPAWRKKALVTSALALLAGLLTAAIPLAFPLAYALSHEATAADLAALR